MGSVVDDGTDPGIELGSLEVVEGVDTAVEGTMDSIVDSFVFVDMVPWPVGVPYAPFKGIVH